MADKNGQAPAPDWAKFQPPALPEQKKLDAVVEKIVRMTPEQIVRKSIATGIHSEIGRTLTPQYRKPGEY
jgi:hypothetical protein